MKVNIKQIVGSGYEKFWEAKCRYKIVKGGRASKKSKTVALWFIYHIMKNYYLHGVKPCLLVIRKYLNGHRTSTRAELQWAINRLNASHLWHIPKSELSITFIPSGSTILFRGCDDPDSLTSISVPIGNLCYCWFEELFEINDKKTFEKIDLSIRGQLPYPLFYSVVGTLNPWNDLTWIKKEFFDKKDSDIFTDTTTYHCNEFLDMNYLTLLEKMKLNDPYRYKVQGLGQWGNSDGLIYLSYVENPEKNHAELQKNEHLMIITCGIDYGSGSKESKFGKTTICAVGITDNFEKVYCLDESYFDGHFLPERIVKWAVEFLVKIKEKYKVDIYLNCEWASSSAINNALKLAILENDIDGIHVQDAYKDTILNRIDLCQFLLAEKRLLFTENVPEIKKAFLTALWDTEKQKIKKVPIRRDDGTSNICALDTVEYALTRYTNYLMVNSKITQ
ncbi:MAG: PBSX family phage terminase large subunit [Treponema sp.]|nr:PBSX family phage terminase large subunit [Treponema sp.]